MSIPAHKPSEPAEVTDLSALFEFAEEATLDQAPAAPAASRAEQPVAATAEQPRDARATRGHVDAEDGVADDLDRRDEAQGKSNLEEILGGDLPLEALEPPSPIDAHFEDETELSEEVEPATASPSVVARDNVDRTDPPLQKTADAVDVARLGPAVPELRLALEDAAIAEPELLALDLRDSDAAEEFESADAEPFEASEPEAAEPVETLTVADLLALGVELSWQEAVSVVLEWLQGWNDPDHCPDPASAALREGGRIELLSEGQVSGPAVPAAAMLLTDLLGSAKTPPQLREVIENDRIIPTEHADLAQFTSALSYFGRPNRRVDLAAVHTRLHESRRRVVAEHELSRLRARVVRVPRHRGLPRWVTIIADRARENPLTFVLWLLVGMNSLAFFWLSISSRAEAPLPTVAVPSAPEVAAALAPPPPEFAEPEPAREAATPPPVTRRPLNEATQTTQTRTALPPSPPAAAVLPTAGPRVSAGAASAPRGTRAAAPQNAPTAVRESSTPGRPVNSTASAPAAGALAAPNPPRPAETAPVRVATPERPPTAVERRPATRADDGRLYSARDVDVTPPRLLRPVTHNPDFASSLGGDAAEFELVVGPTGRVERVRMLKPSERLEDKMLLAAAKAWEFDPAVRDGVPVWYRLTVRIP